MKILEITNYSAGICGVWNRVKEEAIRLSKLGHKVKVFSSNFVKGSNEIAKFGDKIGDVEIKRLPKFLLRNQQSLIEIFENATSRRVLNQKIPIKRFSATKMPFSESYMIWNSLNLKKEIIKFKPNIIIAHSYRHTHTIIASRIAKEIGARCFLVTHAPFGDENRNFLAKIYLRYFYDPFIGKKVLKRFDKIIAITKWENSYLKKLGVSEDKTEYIPNGIPEEFFDRKKSKEENKILFLGRISPVKDLETLIKSFKLIKDKKIKLEIVGPAEEGCLIKLKRLVEELDLGNRVLFSPAIYDLKEKIRKIDSAKIFVLPSLREGMPQGLIEAMAREKFVISSNNDGGKELIEEGKNGYLFRVGDYKELARKIDLVLSIDQDKVRKEARKSVERFSWDKIIMEWERVIDK